jgi:iron(III) transport system ATP-binding protein
MIAGFNSIEGGTIRFNQDVINDIPAHKRNIGMVFQNYAIFPHLTVRQNVEYGLKLRKLGAREIKQKVDDILEVVKITDYQDRLPERLSGGQQQRVALARAIVIHPTVLLMDEPLSNLDAKLRVEMRGAIREIQKHIGITTVYVTHDQEEALAISDRIAVMERGEIQQVGTPEGIYSHPDNVFVSTFIGHSNLLHAAASGSAVTFQGGYRITVPALRTGADEKPVVVAVRPEEFQAASEGLSAKIIKKTFLGKYVNYELQFPALTALDGQPSIEYSQHLGDAQTHYFQEGETITLAPNPKKINVFSQDHAHNLTGDGSGA